MTSCREYIRQHHGAKYLPEAPIVYSSKSGAQEAHEAIRPSNVDIRPGSLDDMEVDARRLYQLIWQQFVACQLTNAAFTATTITVPAGGFDLAAKCSLTRFDGYLAVMPAKIAKDEGDELPALQHGDRRIRLLLLPQLHLT